VVGDHCILFLLGVLGTDLSLRWGHTYYIVYDVAQVAFLIVAAILTASCI